MRILFRCTYMVNHFFSVNLLSTDSVCIVLSNEAKIIKWHVLKFIISIPN